MSRGPIFMALWALAIWLFTRVAAPAADQPEWRVTLDVQMVAISPEKALKLIPALRESATFDTAFAEIQQMIERDEADLVGWPIVIAPHLARIRNLGSPVYSEAGGDNGPSTPESGASESVNEAVYPTEFLPPLEPQIFGGPASLIRFLQIQPGGCATCPTAFETRKLGVTLEGESAVSNDGNFIQLSVIPQRVLSLGYQRIRVATNPARIDGICYAPQFLMAKTSSYLTVRNGKRMLLGIFVETKPEAKMLLFLMKATATPTGVKSSLP